MKKRLLTDTNCTILFGTTLKAIVFIIMIVSHYLLTRRHLIGQCWCGHGVVHRSKLIRHRFRGVRVINLGHNSYSISINMCFQLIINNTQVFIIESNNFNMLLIFWAMYCLQQRIPSWPSLLHKTSRPSSMYWYSASILIFIYFHTDASTEHKIKPIYTDKAIT